jgi:4-aminobutyrate aminotransferase-like enzyme
LSGTGSLEGSELLAQRLRHLGPSLSLAYRDPLTLVRGEGQYLFDPQGRRYLDLVNNVCHVGHCHPAVAAAAAAQMATLNTNTRYLHPNIVEYANRLTALLPGRLEVCFFVCSGSEANDLALRLARSHTRSQGVVTVEGAYHGNLTSLIEISPYKYDGPGGAGAPPWVEAIPMPDGLRGRYSGDDTETGHRYASHVGEATRALEDRQFPAAAFICESLMGCGGQVEPPPGFLVEAFRQARRAGAVVIADEVQVGFGRVGERFWGFELQEAVPDIVTLGKPIGNGHPLAAVVTTREIADSFDNGMEYFNTFGGNPVSCAVGLAVLDVIEAEGLQENARCVGAAFGEGLKNLARIHPLIAAVRGRGLFLGAELLREGEPAAVEATSLVEKMKEQGFLLSTGGPDHNVIKIKPPMVITESDAADMLAALDKVLGGI